MNFPARKIRHLLEKVYSRYVIDTYVKFLNSFDNIRIHPSSHIALHTRLNPRDGEITIGRKSHIHNQVMILPYGGEVTLGNNCTVNPFCILYGHGGLTIGNDVRIAASTTIVPANHVFDDVNVPIYQQGETREGITIGDDVWIGTGVRILDGTTIGSGSVIAAGSVVTSSIPEYSIAAGVPAEVVKSRRDKADTDRQ